MALGDEQQQAFPRDFSGLVTRQRLHLKQRSRQKHRIKAFGQCGQQLPLAEFRGDCQRHEPINAASGFRRHEEYALDDSSNPVELMVEISQRTALAGNIDQIFAATKQPEFSRAARFHHVAENDRLRQVRPGQLALIQCKAVIQSPAVAMQW